MVKINNKSWQNLRLSDIVKHLNEDDDETFFFEYKSDNVSTHKFIEEVSAFSNTYGGYIFLGVEDDKSITGCTNWTEQKIHTTIHDSITPTPKFDVKKFKTTNGNIFIVRIEEGELPPYITNKGKIFTRISSGSYQIKDSATLAQLYSKRKDNTERLKNKLYIEELDKNHTPYNLCGYVDIGFEVQTKNKDRYSRNFFIDDCSNVVDFLTAELSIPWSVSGLGNSLLVTIGTIETKQHDKVCLTQASMNNFIEIMPDGSVRCRFVLLADQEANNRAPMDAVLVNLKIYKKIYELLFGANIKKEFIYAQKYEKLAVIKQFVPYFKTLRNDGEDPYDVHQGKYGKNIVVTGTRIPKNDFRLIDRQCLEQMGVKYTGEAIISELFYTNLSVLGLLEEYEIKS